MSRNGDATRARIYDAVRTLTAQHRRPPTVRQSAEHCELSSSGHVYQPCSNTQRIGNRLGVSADLTVRKVS